MSSFHQLLEERVGQATPLRKLNAEEAKLLARLIGIAEKLKQDEIA